MKKLLTILFVMALSLSAMAQSKKTMVVYFSASGITEGVAKKVAAEAGCELMAITPEVAYTDADLDYRNTNSRSTNEMKDEKSRPAIKDFKSLAKYETIYLGYPIWWNVAPRIVNTFIEKAKLDGKKVIPFATSGSSSISNSTRVLKETYPKINWQEGKLLSRISDEAIKEWVKSQTK